MTLQFIEPEIHEFNTEIQQPASYIRKVFHVDGNLTSASLALTALGVYKAWLDGEEIDPQYLLPGFTNYAARVQVQEYDLTSKLAPGAHVLSVVLGDGWYRGALGLTSVRNYYGNRVKFAATLKLCYTDHEEEIITDESWKATQDGPIVRNDLKTYEEVDMRKELTGWMDADYDDSAWHACRIGSYNGELVPHEGLPVLEQEVFDPKVLHTPDGNTVLDFGQNLAGHVCFQVTGAAGTQVKLIMGETLNSAGNFTLENLQAESFEREGALGQTLIYTLKDGPQEYRSQFLISGYRYVLLQNWPEEVKAENFRSIAVYSALTFTGNFSCSNEKINRLVQNSMWAQRSNFVDIPTDCPTRERAGWTGDISVFSETASYYTDTRQFLHKWLKDAVSMQTPQGNLPFIVPKVPLDVIPGVDATHLPYGSAGWSDAIIHVPMVLYRMYGDTEALGIVYDAASRFIDFEMNRAKEKHPLHEYKPGDHHDYILDTGFHFGEWLEPGSVMFEDVGKALSHPDAEVATAWLFHSVSEMAQMAEILGKQEDVVRFAELAEKIKAAYRIEFLTNGTVVSERQCRYVRPLSMHLLTEESAKKVSADLNKMVVDNGYKLGTGFLTTWCVLSTLADHGYVDTAYRLLENEQCPGWLYEVNKGATTTWENWLGVDEDGRVIDSHNHYAPGAAMSFLFAYTCGIQPAKPGFEEIVIRPIPGGSLTWAKAEYISVKGKIVSAWEKADGKVKFHVEIPDGVPASVILPDGTAASVTGGVHNFECA